MTVRIAGPAIRTVIQDNSLLCVRTVRAQVALFPWIQGQDIRVERHVLLQVFPILRCQYQQENIQYVH